MTWPQLSAPSSVSPSPKNLETNLVFKLPLPHHIFSLYFSDNAQIRKPVGEERRRQKDTSESVCHHRQFVYRIRSLAHRDAWPSRPSPSFFDSSAVKNRQQDPPPRLSYHIISLSPAVSHHLLLSWLCCLSLLIRLEKETFSIFLFLLLHSHQSPWLFIAYHLFPTIRSRPDVHRTAHGWWIGSRSKIVREATKSIWLLLVIPRNGRPFIHSFLPFVCFSHTTFVVSNKNKTRRTVVQERYLIHRSIIRVYIFRSLSE